MLNKFVSLPVVGSGPGAAVDVSQMGKTKTFTIDGSFNGAVHVEVANDLAGTDWAPLLTFNLATTKTIEVSARWLRTNSVDGAGATVAVGSSESGTLFAELVAPAGDGVGAAADTSALPAFKTVVVSGPVTGALFIETSEDGVTFNEVLTFQGADSARQQSATFFGVSARVRRDGSGTGIPTVWMAASNSAIGGNSAPLTRIVFRPGNPGGSFQNVCVTWPEVYAAIEAVRKQGGYYVEVDDRFGATTVPLDVMASGVGGSFVAAGGTVTFTAAVGLFTANMVGRGIAITGAASPLANDGNFTILSVVSPTTITYRNSNTPTSGFTEPFAGNWVVGGYNITNAIFTNTPEASIINAVTLMLNADGAFFVTDEPQVRTVRIEGFGLNVRSNRVGPIAPFFNLNLILDGNQVQLSNNNPAALPMVVGGGNNTVLFTGSCRGSVGGAAPVIDCNGGQMAVGGGGGSFNNTSITDLVGGGTLLIRQFDDSVNSTSSLDFPAFIAAGGIMIPSVEHRDRHRVESVVSEYTDGVGDDFTIDGDGNLVLTDAAGLFVLEWSGVAYVTIAGATTPANDGTFLITEVLSTTQLIIDNPAGVAEVFPGTWVVDRFIAFLNELKRVDTTGGPVTIEAPFANTSPGERLVVKDVGGSALANNITVANQPGDIVEADTISTNFGCKTWVCDGGLPLGPSGPGTWMHVSSN